MKIIAILLILIISCELRVKGSDAFRKIVGSVSIPQQTLYYNGHSYQYPLSTYQQPYAQSANGYYYQPHPLHRQPQRHRTQQVKEKSYKDICHMIHHDGFTNPGNVPKCPF